MREYTIIEEKVLEILDSQFYKGLKNYHQTLADCPEDAYDWNTMTMEELVDALSYQIKENLKLVKQMNKVMTENLRHKAKLEEIYFYLDSFQKNSLN